MSAQDTVNELVDRINSKDLDGVMALYEPEAVFAVKPGEVVKGTKAIREIFSAAEVYVGSGKEISRIS